MTDLTNLKIQTFSGINDSPIAPTASKAGNGSHLIQQINSLIDALSVTSSNSNWSVVSNINNYNVQSNDQLLLPRAPGDESPFIVNLPTNFQLGESFKFIKNSPNLLEINSSGSYVNGQYPSRVLVQNVEHEIITCIWNGTGWSISPTDLISIEPGSQAF